jgi:hypothetical protein
MTPKGDWSLTRPVLQCYLALVSPDLQGLIVVLVVMGMSHLHGVSQVPPFSPTIGVATTLMVGSSSSGVGDAETPAMKTHSWPFLLVSSQYGIVCRFTLLLLFLFLFCFKRWCWGDRSHTSSTSIVCRPTVR